MLQHRDRPVLEWVVQPWQTGLCWEISWQSRLWAPLNSPPEVDQVSFLPWGLEAPHSKAVGVIWAFSCGLSAGWLAQTGTPGLLQEDHTTWAFWADVVTGRIAYSKMKEVFGHWRDPPYMVPILTCPLAELTGASQTPLVITGLHCQHFQLRSQSFWPWSLLWRPGLFSPSSCLNDTLTSFSSSWETSHTWSWHCVLEEELGCSPAFQLC